MYIPPWAFPIQKPMKSFDIDGVIYLGDLGVGVFPGPEDILITGRSYQEAPKTLRWLQKYGITNQVFFNPLDEKDKTRQSSGEHKARILRGLIANGFGIGVHFEDDPIQKKIIEETVPSVKVVHLVHELTEK